MTALATGLKNYLTFSALNGNDIAIDRSAVIAVEDTGKASGETKVRLYCEGGHSFDVTGDIGAIKEQLGS